MTLFEAIKSAVPPNDPETPKNHRPTSHRNQIGGLLSRQRTPRDDVWDELATHFGEPRTKTERTQFGKVVNELMETAATPEEVTKACLYVKGAFDNPSVFAVTKWFTVAQQAQEKLSPQQAAIEQLRRV